MYVDIYVCIVLYCYDNVRSLVFEPNDISSPLKRWMEGAVKFVGFSYETRRSYCSILLISYSKLILFEGPTAFPFLLHFFCRYKARVNPFFKCKEVYFLVGGACLY